ncbi:MAG TPA: hypothetical protein VMT17_06835 [Anaeromyxobacteraceae bacterium]|nr:hypothetical protein [Anaeromyxobacteraceae bacterium]
MKSIGTALAVGLILGPIGVMSLPCAAIGVGLALAVSAMGGGLASAVGLVPTRDEVERARNWN